MLKRLLPLALLLATFPAQAQMVEGATDGEAILKDFTFRSGEKLPELKMHYTTLGKPQRDASGAIVNAVMILHGTGGTGRQFLQPQFAGELFGPGQPLDAAKYYIILPDNIGHGGSSKASDGMRMAFPRYDYDDMVAAQHRLLTESWESMSSSSSSAPRWGACTPLSGAKAGRALQNGSRPSLACPSK